MKGYFLLIVMGMLNACAKDNTPSGELNGTYVGNYLETGSLQDSGTVKIVFVGSNFSGTSMGTSRSICNGGYVVSGDSINFSNLCSTPDPELLLAGKYELTKTSDSLYFTRTFSGVMTYTEQFSLKMQ